MYYTNNTVEKSKTPQLAAGFLTLAAFAKWMLTHPLGSLLAEIKECVQAERRQRDSMISFEEFILEDDSPIYLQIIRYIKQGIASGVIGDQEEVPSRRALSALLGVNPNTIQKAYHMLEEEGVISSRSGAKSCTCVEGSTIERIREELLQSDTDAWIKAMRRLGMERDEALRLAGEMWESF